VIGLLMLAGGAAGATSPVHAQIFCPPNFSFSNGICTFNGVPANSGFSVAALSSEALSEVAQSLSQQTTSRTLEAVRERRETETAACPANSERFRGECRPRAVRADRPGTPSPQTAAPMIVKALPPSADVAPRYSPAVWTQVFGDFEKRDHITSPEFNDLGAKTTTWSVISGFDFTFRNVGTGGDVLLLGLLAGYTSSDVHFTGSSTVAHVTGPSVGAYGVYVRGPFSTDLTFKADLFSLDEIFSEIIGTNPPIVNAGTASVDMTNFIVANNYNYRIPLSAAQWIEPTVGFRFTQTNYGAGAAALGLADGHVFRVQGGARVGNEADWNGIHVTTVVTGLAYSDVSITGGTATTDGFINPTIFASDEGKLRGEGIFALNLDYLNGWSSFALADVRGGQDFFGYGGRLGLRYQW
jgi:outer membrane autotransporter protein